jgi:TolA-binding protein
MKQPLRIATTLAATLIAAQLGQADTIYLLDGKAISDVRIHEESLKEITYREEGKSTNQSVSSDAVMAVEFSRMPKAVDEAETAARDNDVAGAADVLAQYLKDQVEGTERETKFKWAPAYASWRLVELYLSGGNLAGVLTETDRLLKTFPDSRYVPHAYLARAEAQRLSDKGQAAVATLAEFRTLIDAKGLARRWGLEVDLATVLSDANLKGQAKRDRLIEIQSAAGNEFPTVRNRAQVAEGESYLEGQTKDFAAARNAFQRIAENPRADRATLAGAYTGLGDCLFQEAVDQAKAKADPAMNLEAALESYLRVIVVYKEQARYVPKAMFYAGRVFEFRGDEEGKGHARQMYRRVVQRYGESTWAAEAKKQLGS